MREMIKILDKNMMICLVTSCLRISNIKTKIYHFICLAFVYILNVCVFDCILSI